MGLLDRVRADLNRISTNPQISQSVELPFTDPAGTAGTVNGLANDIGVSEDADTGVAIRGRFVSAFVSLAEFSRVGLGVPRGYERIADAWTVDYDGQRWAVRYASVDETSAGVLMTLEVFNA